MHPPSTTPTALLVIDLQLGLTHPTAHGPIRSTPTLESNLMTLLSTARNYNTTHPTHPIHIIHIHHHSITPDSQLHPSHIINWSPDPTINGRPGIDPIPCAMPAPGEPVLTKNVNSAFIGTGLEEMLVGLGVRQIVVVGMTTEHCVSTTVRMAANLNVARDAEGMGERGVVVVEDGCACFGKVGRGGRVWEAEDVHQVELECLKGEFAEGVVTEEVVGVIRMAMGEKMR